MDGRGYVAYSCAVSFPPQCSDSWRYHSWTQPSDAARGCKSVGARGSGTGAGHLARTQPSHRPELYSGRGGNGGTVNIGRKTEARNGLLRSRAKTRPLNAPGGAGRWGDGKMAG